MKLDARSIAVAVAVGIAANLATTWILARWGKR